MAEIAMPVEIEWAPEERASFQRLTLLWGGTLLVLFPVLGLLGLFMRFSHANFFPNLDPIWFYAALTLHGVGMVGLWFITGFSGVLYLLSHYIRPSLAVSRLSFALTLVGVLLIVIATLIGRFAAGWYFLYPLPYRSGGAWANWATDTYLIALAILGVAWTLWASDLLRAIAQRYSLSQALCWHYLRGETKPEVPPIILITTVSTIASLTGFVAAVILLAFFAADRLAGVPADPLLMKNLVFYFGHVLVNITMYLGVAMLYDVLPQYVGRPWKTTATTAFAWNTVLLLVLFAYFHHLYMDFVQPKAFHVLGQMASYMISVPAAVVSILGTLAMVYRTKVRWTLASSLLFAGTMGWAVGGVAAVIDSTIAINFRFHNTLWVPAHFHTYFLMGVVLMIMGFLAHLTAQLSGREESPTLRRTILTLLLVGGYGFLLMFYLAGAHHVPRRYAVYPEELAQGILYAQLSLPFIALLSIGILLYIWEVGKRWAVAFATAGARSS